MFIYIYTYCTINLLIFVYCFDGVTISLVFFLHDGLISLLQIFARYRYFCFIILSSCAVYYEITGQKF